MKKISDDKMKSLNLALDKLEKTYGKGSVGFMDNMPIQDLDVISTSCTTLDLALGIGGLPKGRITEIYGPESSGKTTLCLHAIAECQKEGGVAAFIDAEHAFDKTYARALGVDTSNLLISQPDNGEQALEIAEKLVCTGAIDMLVVDSVAALTPRAEIEGEMGDSKMGLQARLMSQACRKLTSKIGENNVCFVFINQLREKIGVMFGNPETTTGGNALKFYASVRIDIRKSGSAVKDKEGNVISSPTKVKVVKNKLAPPFTTAMFHMRHGIGIDKLGDILDLAAEKDVISKSGSWYSYNGTKIAQGRESARQFLSDNEELYEEIKQKVIDSVKEVGFEEASVESALDNLTEEIN